MYSLFEIVILFFIVLFRLLKYFTILLLIQFTVYKIFNFSIYNHIVNKINKFLK